MTKYWAEFIGTFSFVLIGCGSVVAAGAHIGYMGVALAFGLALLAMYYVIGPISGCHINPAVTIGMLVAHRISIKDTIGYIIGQFLGATLAIALLLSIVQGMPNYDMATMGLGQNGFGDASPSGYSLSAVLILEIAMSAIFVLVAFASASKVMPKGFAGIAMGVALIAIYIISIPIDGGSVNPARSFGPALFMGGDPLAQLWLFILAPLAGAVIAALVWTIILKGDMNDE